MMDDSQPSKKAYLVERNVVPQGIPLNDPDTVAKISEQDLVTLAQEIQKADEFIKANMCSKLQVIAEQIKLLKKQAEDVLLEADWNAELHHVPCNFVKHPGHVYHLYQRETGQLYFSMLSPKEWGTSGPSQTHKGSYRLEQDHSWTPLHLVEKKSKELAMIGKLFSTVPTALKSIDSNIKDNI